jgi:hypothetical protein
MSKKVDDISDNKLFLHNMSWLFTKYFSVQKYMIGVHLHVDKGFKGKYNSWQIRKF